MKTRMKITAMSLALITSMSIGTLSSCKHDETTASSTSTTTSTVAPTTSATSATESATSSETEIATFEFTKENYPTIDGSTANKPMAVAVTSVLLGISREEADSMLAFHKTDFAFDYLMNGEADILIVAEPADFVINNMTAHHFEYEMEPFANEGLVFVVNVNNPVESLTVEQIQKIYTGEITNWKEVGGEDCPIAAIQRNEASGSQVMMRHIVMGDLELMEAPTEMVPADMEGLIETVKSYDNSANAIGYTPYYYATNMKMADDLKIIKINDIEPSAQTIASQTYPFLTAYYVVIGKKAPEDSPARIMFNWILSEEGQKLAEMEGYVPAK